MSDKLEALSQPVAYTFDEQSKPLYSQEYVTALLVNLNAEKQCKDAATANLTAASTCISELSNRVHSLLAALEEKDQRIAELNVKLFDQSILLDAAISRAEATERREEHLKASVDVLSAKNAELQKRLQQPSLADVMAERQRQISTKGYDIHHDDMHVNDEIAALAAWYVMPPAARDWNTTSTGYGDTLGEAILPGWLQPKGKDRRRELVIGAALTLAEIERLDRESAKATGSVEQRSG